MRPGNISVIQSQGLEIQIFGLIIDISTYCGKDGPVEYLDLAVCLRVVHRCERVVEVKVPQTSRMKLDVNCLPIDAMSSFGVP